MLSRYIYLTFFNCSAKRRRLRRKARHKFYKSAEHTVFIIVDGTAFEAVKHVSSLLKIL